MRPDRHDDEVVDNRFGLPGFRVKVAPDSGIKERMEVLGVTTIPTFLG